MSSAKANLKVFETDEQCYQYAYEQIAEVVRKKPNAVIGLATGSTPVRIYDRLAAACKKGELDFSHITTVNLDEYVGLTPTHKQSYKEFMRENLMSKINIDPNNTHIPQTDAADPEAECRRYEQTVARLAPVDIWLLGVGVNGHVAFNEPGTPIDAPTHVVKLTKNTIEVNSRFFKPGEHQPTTAMTVGIGTLRKYATRMIVVCTGEAKANAVYSAVCKPATPDCPLSLIRDKAEIIADKAAASKIE